MRFLLLNPFDAHAGSQRVARDMADRLRGAGHDVQVKLGFGGGGFLTDMSSVRADLRVAKVRVRKLLYPLWAMMIALPVLLAVLRGRTLWANTVYAAPPALLAAIVRPSQVIVHLHEATFPRPFISLLRLMTRRGVRLICVSREHAARIGLPATVLYNAVTLPVRDEPSACDRLLFVGTTQAIKGFDLFVAVCEALRDLPLRKSAYLSDETRHDKALVADARRAGIEVIFGESNSDTLYRDGFLLFQATDPALWVETFSLVAVEAIARCVPVASAGTTVLSEVLGEALAFDEPSRSPQEIVNAIRVLHSDLNRHDTLRAACAHRRTIFSEQTFLERLATILPQMNGH